MSFTWGGTYPGGQVPEESQANSVESAGTANEGFSEKATISVLGIELPVWLVVLIAVAGIVALAVFVLRRK